MDQFIIDVKKDRSNEIQIYRDKGIKVDSKNYCLTDRLSYYSCLEKQYIGISVNKSNIYFLYTDQGAKINFSIDERYAMLAMVKRIYPGIINIFCEQLKHTNEQISFTYRSKEYKVLKPVDLITEEEYEIPIIRTGTGIKLSKLMSLILFSQSLSNAYCKTGTKGRKEYLNGTLRLYTALLSTEGNDVLKDRGWCWDNAHCMYRLEDKVKSQKIFNLTLDEFQSIMEKGNSRSRL